MLGRGPWHTSGARHNACVSVCQRLRRARATHPQRSPERGSRPKLAPILGDRAVGPINRTASASNEHRNIVVATRMDFCWQYCSVRARYRKSRGLGVNTWLHVTTSPLACAGNSHESLNSEEELDTAHVGFCKPCNMARRSISWRIIRLGLHRALAPSRALVGCFGSFNNSQGLFLCVTGLCRRIDIVTGGLGTDSLQWFAR
jgi:hypothetical protein